MSFTAPAVYEDVVSRMPDVGLATASEEQSDKVEIVERKLVQASEQLEIELLTRIQNTIDRYEVNNTYNAATVLATLTTASKAYMKQCHIAWTCAAMFEEGETKFRFLYKDAPESITDLRKYWMNEKRVELERVMPLLRFDIDANGTEESLDRLFRKGFSSVRVLA